MPRVIPNQIAFDADNFGRSFFNQYQLRDADGKGTDIFVEVHDEDHAEQIARRVAAVWNACAGISTEDLESGLLTVIRAEETKDAADEILGFLREQGFVSADEFLRKAEEQREEGIEVMINPNFGKKEVVH